MLSTSYAVIQSLVPEHIRGRVMGILAIHISLGVLGGLVAGGVGEFINIRVGVGLTHISSIYYLCLNILRNLSEIFRI